MTVTFPSVQFLAGLGDGTTKRTMTQRTGEIFNVKDYGAKGDGSNNDTSAIQAAITAMYAANEGIVFFPPGFYKVTSTIDVTNHVSGHTGGIITGAGRNSVTLAGAIDTGFIFSVTDGLGCPEEISNLSLVNSSTVIGTGCLFINNSTCGRITNCHFSGMINILMPFNMFQTSIDNCTGEGNSDATTGCTGTFGIIGYACNISSYRTTWPFQAGIQLYGVNTQTISACSNENCTVGLLAGMTAGWASQCTVSGTTLTVGGNLGSSFPQFSAGSEIFMKGVTTPADWAKSPLDASLCTIVSQLTGTTGLAGTYQITRSATVSSPVPCLSRGQYPITSATFLGYSTEACHYPIFVMSTGACAFVSCGGSGNPVECVNAFGTPGLTPHSCFYIFSASATTFVACSAHNNPYLASWYFDSNKNNTASFVNCNGYKAADNVTGTSSSITGTVLNVVSYSGSSIGIGMKVTGSGVSANTVITGNNLTDGTLTGTAGTGTYRVNNSQTVTATAITIHTGDDWLTPTTDSGKTGLNFYNCNTDNLPAGYVTNLNSLNRTYGSLPGNVGSNNNFPVQDGMEYAIVDGLAANCADGTCTTFGTNVTGGGGALHLKVRWNATKAHWTLTGV